MEHTKVTVGKDERSYRTLAIDLLTALVREIAEKGKEETKNGPGTFDPQAQADALGTALVTSQAVEWLKRLPRELCPNVEPITNLLEAMGNATHLAKEGGAYERSDSDSGSGNGGDDDDPTPAQKRQQSRDARADDATSERDIPFSERIFRAGRTGYST